MNTKNYLKKLRKFLKTDLGFVLIAFVIWRILMFVVGWQANVHFDFVPLSHSFNDNTFWNIWANWDGEHYRIIAEHGYLIDPFRTVFFPLFPYLIRVVTSITGLNFIHSGLIVTSSALIMAGFWLIKLIKLDYSEKVARNSFILLLLFPSAVFLSAIYTESLFLMTTIGALYFARKKNWWAVLLLGFGAGLTRNLGAFLVFPLLYEYFKQYKFKIRWPIIAAGASGFGIVSYMGYLWAKLGDPLLFVHYQSLWQREIVVNIFWRFNQAYHQAINSLSGDPTKMIEFASVVFMIVMITLMIIKKIRPSYIIWSVLLILIPVMQNYWMSMNRYVLVVFPIYIIFSLYSEKYEYLIYILYVLFAVGLFYHIALFVNLGWIG